MKDTNVNGVNWNTSYVASMSLKDFQKENAHIDKGQAEFIHKTCREVMGINTAPVNTKQEKEGDN
jgi:hypothetical protein